MLLCVYVHSQVYYMDMTLVALLACMTFTVMCIMFIYGEYSRWSRDVLHYFRRLWVSVTLPPPLPLVFSFSPDDPSILTILCKRSC